MKIIKTTWDEIRAFDMRGVGITTELFLVHGPCWGTFVSCLYESFDVNKKQKVRCFIHPRSFFHVTSEDDVEVYKLEPKMES